MGDDHLIPNTEELLNFKKANPLLVKLTNQQIDSFGILCQLSWCLDLTQPTEVVLQETGQVFREAFLFLMSGKPRFGLYMLRVGLGHTRDALRLLDDQKKSDCYEKRLQTSEAQIESDQSDFDFDFDFDYESENEKILSKIYELCRGAQSRKGSFDSKNEDDFSAHGYTVGKPGKNGKVNGWLWNHVFLRVQAALIAKLLKDGDRGNQDIKKLSNRWIKEWKIASRRVTLWSLNSKGY